MPDDEYSYPLHMAGTASTLPPEPEREGDEAVRRLHQCIEEITGKPARPPALPKPRMGFL